MHSPDLIGLFVYPLERLGATYMITGGVASVIYGDPRFTRDIDVVLNADVAELQEIVLAFPENEYYVPPVEIVRAEAARRQGGHFNIIHTDSALKVDIYLAGVDPLHVWALERRRRISLTELSIWLAPIEYVILRKLEYHQQTGSERHIRDIREMLRISAEIIDRNEISAWATGLGVASKWKDLLQGGSGADQPIP